MSERESASDWIDGPFLRGPLPLSWLSSACSIPGGNALAVALAIWFVAGCEKRRDQLKLTTKTLNLFGVNPSAKSRALEALKRAGLIDVQTKRGKNPLVTILQVEERRRSTAA